MLMLALALVPCHPPTPQDWHLLANSGLPLYLNQQSRHCKEAPNFSPNPGLKQDWLFLAIPGLPGQRTRHSRNGKEASNFGNRQVYLTAPDLLTAIERCPLWTKPQSKATWSSIPLILSPPPTYVLLSHASQSTRIYYKYQN